MVYLHIVEILGGAAQPKCWRLFSSRREAQGGGWVGKEGGVAKTWMGFPDLHQQRRSFALEEKLLQQQDLKTAGAAGEAGGLLSSRRYMLMFAFYMLTSEVSIGW